MNFIPCILSLIFLSGCFAHAPVKMSVFSGPEVSGAVVDAAGFKKGGTLQLAAFKAGPQAEADEQLDKISLMLIRGIRERLQAQAPLFIITNQPQEADFIMQGYVEEFYQPGKFARWVLRKKQSRLCVSGEIWRKDSGTKVLTFASSRAMDIKHNSPDEEAFLMGQAIGNFIAAQAAKE